MRLWHQVKNYRDSVSTKLVFLEHFVQNHEQWREAVQLFYLCSKEQAKKVFLRALFGGQALPSLGPGDTDLLDDERKALWKTRIPHMTMLKHDFHFAVGILASMDTEHKRIYHLPRCHVGDTVPGRVTHSLYLGTKEHAAMKAAIKILEASADINVQSLVHDGVIVKEKRDMSTNERDNVMSKLESLHGEYGVRIQKKYILPPPVLTLCIFYTDKFSYHTEKFI